MLRFSVRWSIAAALCTLGALYARAADRPTAPSGSSVLAESDVAAQGDCIVLPVTIAGKEYPFLLDTGSTNTVVDRELASELGGSVGENVAGGADGALVVQFLRPKPVLIGRIRITPTRPFVSADLTVLRRVAGREFRGVIGVDSLSDRVVQIDFDGGKLRFLAEVPPKFPRGTRAVPIIGDETVGGPCIRGTIRGNKETAFFVDTGDTGSMSVTRDVVQLLISTRSGRIVDSGESASLAGVRPMRVARVESFSLGDWAFPGIVATESGSDRIGLGFLSRFQVTLDFVNDVMYLTPGKNFNKRDLRDWSGMKVLLIDGKVTVLKTKDASPARAGGILAGDVISAIDGEPAKKYSLFQLRNMLKERDTVRLTIRRGDEELSIRLDRPKEAAERPSAEASGCPTRKK